MEAPPSPRKAQRLLRTQCRHWPSACHAGSFVLAVVWELANFPLSWVRHGQARGSFRVSPNSPERPAFALVTSRRVRRAVARYQASLRLLFLNTEVSLLVSGSGLRRFLKKSGAPSPNKVPPGGPQVVDQTSVSCQVLSTYDVTSFCLISPQKGGLVQCAPPARSLMCPSCTLPL